MDAASKAASAFWFMSILKTRALIRHFLVQTYLLVGCTETTLFAISSTLKLLKNVFDWMCSLIFQEQVTCTLTGLLDSIYCWEQQEDLLTFMRSQGQGLYIEMSKQVIFCSMQNSPQKYQILDWQSFMMMRKPTSAPGLQGQCKPSFIVFPEDTFIMATHLYLHEILTHVNNASNDLKQHCATI